MGLDRFHQLYELGQEIANTAFWSASVGKEGVKAVYQNPGTGMSSSPILIHNRQEWEYWQEKLGQYKAPQQRIKELEQQLAHARDLIRRLYGSFRWETHTDQQETACKDAEGFLDLPPDKRREW